MITAQAFKVFGGPVDDPHAGAILSRLPRPQQAVVAEPFA
jgi:hypothetical protein